MKIKCPHCSKDIDLTISKPEVKIIEASTEHDIIPILKQKVLYVSSGGLNLRSSPKVKKGNINTTLTFATKVTFLEEQSKWYKVKTNNDITGWVSSYHLSEEKPQQIKNEQIIQSADDELPHFKVGVSNLASDPNTKKLRKIINYEFKFDYNKTCLQCTEYVQYRVQQMGKVIQWPIQSGRNGGNWGNIFKEHGPYKVLNKPEVGCAISFTTGFKTKAMNNIGHIAFVEALLENDAIKISEANWPQPGKYNVRPVSKSEWKDKHKCKFIKFV